MPRLSRLILGCLTSVWKWGNLSSTSDSFPYNHHLSESTNLAINWLIWQMSQPTACVVNSDQGRILRGPVSSSLGAAQARVQVSAQVCLHLKAPSVRAETPPATGHPSAPPRPEGFQGCVVYTGPSQATRQEAIDVEECGRREQRRHLGTGPGRV